MCRLTAYIGTPIVAADLVTRPNHSIITQSFAARERLCETHYIPPCINGDGFGIGWYSADIAEDAEPCIYRSTRPAWNDENLMQLSEKIQSHLLFAHVRAASPGSVVAERLCHPFRCGRYLFMHNGNVGGFDRVRRRLMDRLNDTCFEFAVANGASDTVVCFALFLNTLEDHMAVVSPDTLRQNCESVVELIVTTCQECGVEETSLLNFVISDGLMLLATRFVYDPKSPYSQPASLYFGAGTGYERKQGPGVASGEYQMTHTDRRIKMVIATSEPLSDNHTDWVAVPPNNILVVTPDLHLLLAPIGASAAMSLALENIMSMERLLPQELKASLGPAASRAVGLITDGSHPATPTRRSGTTTPGGGQQEAAMSVGEAEAMHKARHVILGHSDSALALAVSGRRLFSGSQDGSIRVWNIENFTLDTVLQCADEGYSVLAMAVHGDRVLWTTSSDNKLRAWDLSDAGNFALLGTAYMEGMGHPISLAVSGEGVYLGFQDTSVRRLHGPTLLPVAAAAASNSSILPSSPPLLPAPVPIATASGSSTATTGPTGGAVSGSGSGVNSSGGSVKCHPERLGLGAFEAHHCGPVTALTVYGSYVVSGAGDGFVKVWDPQAPSAEEHCLRTLQGHHGSVLTLIAGDGVVISGSRDSTVKVWDMESFSCRRTLRGHDDDVLSLALWGGFLFSGSADGKIIVWRLDTLTYHRAFTSAGQSIQSLVTSPGNLLFSGLNGGMVLAWDMPHEVALHHNQPPTNSRRRGRWGEGDENGGGNGNGEEEEDEARVGERDEESELTMEACLGEFVSYQTVSASEEAFHKEECWRCAKFLTSLLERLGASVKMVSLVEGRSPVVLARFGSDPAKPTVTLYGHYDVVPATERAWKSDPFGMVALNGYLYGRGVTDNKGPIMAMIFALKEMKESGKLKDMNAVLLLEGEEESSSEGFRETVLQNLHWFRGTGLILQANSTWIAEDRPCLTYGMRGTIHIEVRVHGPKRNLHSGIDGGAVVEPLNDLVGILATLVDSRGMVLVPDFYAEVEEVSQEELDLFDAMNLNIESYKASLGVKGLTCTSGREVLAGRWRQPTLSINQVASSNPTDSYSILPKAAMAKVSVRTVPRQNPARIVELIRAHLKHEFGKRRSPNDLFIEVKKVGDWWYGDRNAEAFAMAEAAITDVWGQRPLYVREGGTMPITAFLEDLLKAPAIHLPLGQSSDNAHLPNERIRYLNLTNGREIIKHILGQVGERAKKFAGHGANANGAAHSRHHSRVSSGALSALAASALSLSPRSGPVPHAHAPGGSEDPAVLMQMPSVVRRASSVPPNLTLALTSTEPAIHRPTTARSPSPGPPLLPLQRNNMSPTSLVFAGGVSPPNSSSSAGALQSLHHHHPQQQLHHPTHHHHRTLSGVVGGNGSSSSSGDLHGTPTHVHHPFTLSHPAPSNVAPHQGGKSAGAGGGNGAAGPQQQQQR